MAVDCTPILANPTRSEKRGPASPPATAPLKDNGMDKLIIPVTVDSTMSYPGNTLCPPTENVPAVAAEYRTAASSRSAPPPTFPTPTPVTYR